MAAAAYSHSSASLRAVNRSALTQLRTNAPLSKLSHHHRAASIASRAWNAGPYAVPSHRGTAFQWSFPRCPTPYVCRSRYGAASSGSTARRVAVRAGGAEESSEPEQLLLFRVRGDGNCLFRSVAQGYHMQSKGVGVREALSKGEETVAAAALRSKVIQELKARRSEIEPFIDEDYDDYLRKMSCDGTWGGEPELAAATHALEMPIRVYTLTTAGQVQLVNEYGGEYHAHGAGVVSIFFHGMGHYDLLASP